MCTILISVFFSLNIRNMAVFITLSAETRSADYSNNYIFDFCLLYEMFRTMFLFSCCFLTMLYF